MELADQARWLIEDDSMTFYTYDIDQPGEGSELVKSGGRPLN
jgi:hypothetical protein